MIVATWKGKARRRRQNGHEASFVEEWVNNEICWVD
jgi:hypothetical protein